MHLTAQSRDFSGVTKEIHVTFIGTADIKPRFEPKTFKILRVIQSLNITSTCSIADTDTRIVFYFKFLCIIIQKSALASAVTRSVWFARGLRPRSLFCVSLFVYVTKCLKGYYNTLLETRFNNRLNTVLDSFHNDTYK
jgi:hypothetical protein